MSSNIANTTVIHQTAPSLEGKARVDLVKSDFDAIVWQKGYDVFLDKAIKCSCRNLSDKQPLSACRNCGGSGWVFINRTQTRVVLQSMNTDTKYKDWSEEKLGTVRITALNEQKISHMDRITLTSGRMTTNQVLFPKMHVDEKLRCYTIHNIISIDSLFLFKGTNNKLQLLVPEQDYTIKADQWIELDDRFKSVDNPTVSIRYEHHPQYHIIDITRNVIDSFVIQKNNELNRDLPISFPVHAVGRLSHYVLDQENFNQDVLFDNSYIIDCK